MTDGEQTFASIYGVYRAQYKRVLCYADIKRKYYGADRAFEVDAIMQDMWLKLWIDRDKVPPNMYMEIVIHRVKAHAYMMGKYSQSRRRIAAEHVRRCEVGHEYILPIKWVKEGRSWSGRLFLGPEFRLQTPRTIPELDELVVTEPLRRFMVEASRYLSPQQLAALVLRYVGGIMPPEISRRLGCKLNRANTLLSQARRRLKTHPHLALLLEDK